MAEIELSVLSRQCLDRRLGSLRLLEREVAAWTKARNGGAATVEWQFTTAEARVKLKRLDPVCTADPVALPEAATLLASLPDQDQSKSPGPPPTLGQPTTEVSNRIVARPIVHRLMMCAPPAAAL